MLISRTRDFHPIKFFRREIDSIELNDDCLGEHTDDKIKYFVSQSNNTQTNLWSVISINMFSDN